MRQYHNRGVSGGGRAILFGFNLAVLLFTDTLAAAQSNPPVTIADLVANEIPFLILGVTGVGFLIRREPRETARRLGLDVPRWWHLSLALAGAGLAGGDAPDRHSATELAKQLTKRDCRVLANRVPCSYPGSHE